MYGLHGEGTFIKANTISFYDFTASLMNNIIYIFKTVYLISRLNKHLMILKENRFFKMKFTFLNTKLNNIHSINQDIDNMQSFYCAYASLSLDSTCWKKRGHGQICKYQELFNVLKPYWGDIIIRTYGIAVFLFSSYLLLFIRRDTKQYKTNELKIQEVRRTC